MRSKSLLLRTRLRWFGLNGGLAAALVFALPSDCAATARAARDAADLCYIAAQNAAVQTGVPLQVLLAITLTETGRSTDKGLRPWPWAINQAGDGHWFPTPEEAVKFAEDQLDLGLRNFDVGCFQLNHRWHSKGFTSTIDMFDPTSNALYAAQFLSDLYSEKGDWSLAAAAYHSRTPEQAEGYKAKFSAILAGLSDEPVQDDVDAPSPPRINRFPLLQAGLSGGSASLVPLGTAGVRLIGGAP
jgi:Transglycosylase SLT domain